MINGGRNVKGEKVVCILRKTLSFQKIMFALSKVWLLGQMVCPLEIPDYETASKFADKPLFI